MPRLIALIGSISILACATTTPIETRTKPVHYPAPLHVDHTVTEALDGFVQRAYKIVGDNTGSEKNLALIAEEFNQAMHVAGSRWQVHLLTPGEEAHLPIRWKGSRSEFYLALTWDAPSEYRWEIGYDAKPDATATILDYWPDYEHEEIVEWHLLGLDYSDGQQRLPNHIRHLLMGMNGNMDPKVYEQAGQNWPAVIADRFNKVAGQHGWKAAFKQFSQDADFMAVMTITNQRGNSWEAIINPYGHGEDSGVRIQLVKPTSTAGL